MYVYVYVCMYVCSGVVLRGNAVSVVLLAPVGSSNKGAVLHSVRGAAQQDVPVHLRNQPDGPMQPRMQRQTGAHTYIHIVFSIIHTYKH